MSFFSLEHIRPTAREVFHGLLQAIENEPQPLLSLIYTVPRPERLGGQAPPRPPNSFLLFKSWISKTFGSEEASIAEEIWWELKFAGSSIVAYFASLQLEAKEKHLQVFPGYKLQRKKNKKVTNGNPDGVGEATLCGMRADASQDGQTQPVEPYYNVVYQTTASSSSDGPSHQSSASHPTLTFSDHTPNISTSDTNARSVTNPWPSATVNTVYLDVTAPSPESSFSMAPVLRYGIFPGEENLLYSPDLSPAIDSPATESSTAPSEPLEPLELGSWPPTGANTWSVSDNSSMTQSLPPRDCLLPPQDEALDMDVFKPDVYNPELDFQYNSFFALPDGYEEDIERQWTY